MADETHEGVLLRDAQVSYLIPSRTQFDVEKRFKIATEARKPFVAAVDQRKSLFFDESVDVYIVLRALHTSDHALQCHLKRLSLTFEAQVVCSHGSQRDGTPPSEVIYRGEPENIETPIILTEEVAEDEASGDGTGGGREGQDGKNTPKLFVNAIWKLTVFMARPRLRLQNPSVIFCLSADLRPSAGSLTTKDGYLPSGQAAGLNLLESFGNDPALGGIRPRLSALRVSRVTPLASEQDQVFSVNKQRNRSLRIYPAVHTRVRFARPNTVPPSLALVAMLEIDFTPYFDCEILLENISLVVADGLVEDLNDYAMMGLPLSCVAHDHVTFSYRLTPTDSDSPSRKSVRDLHIQIDATALVWPEICHPRLTMSWTTPLDFTLPLNPSFGTATPAIQRSHRPGQLSISGGGDISSMKSPSVTRPDAIPALEEAARSEAAAATAPPDIGVAITLTGPTNPVYVGDVFTWDVFIMNHIAAHAASDPVAGNQAPRKLALTPIPTRRRGETRVTRPPSMSGPSARSSKNVMLADAVIDENVVHAMQRGSLVDAPDIVCLSADVRVGPLAPGACHVAELQFLALRDGIVGVEALRVVDLVSNEHVDVYDLPITVVQKRDGFRPESLCR